MRLKATTICLTCAAIALFGLLGAAQGATATAYVGTVNGTNAFEVQSGGSQLYFAPQPDSIYYWNENNGATPGTHATFTYGGETYDRDGMKTFACTDIAYGQAINTIKMQFDYYTGTDTATGLPMGNPSMNFFLTDGSGHYGIWSATSGSAQYTDTVLGDGWTRRVLDCTAFVDDGKNGIAIYEHNDLVEDHSSPFANVGWDDIKNFTIAGFYDYQRTPEGGFEAWNQTLWSDITNVADAGDTSLNEYGITINWGDTVGGMNEDGNGEIGDDANRAYGQAGRLIKNYQLTVDGATYDMTFEAGVVPEPSTFALLAFGGLTALAAAWIRKRRVK